MADILDKFSELDPARAMRQIIARLAALEAGGGGSSESITTGVSPVAADPETIVTHITTDGSGLTRSITLGLPSDPAANVGRTKRFVMRTLANYTDHVSFDLTNILDSDGQVTADSTAMTDALRYPYSVLEFRLVYSMTTDPPRFAWVPAVIIVGGVLQMVFSDLLTLEGDSFSFKFGAEAQINTTDADLTMNPDNDLVFSPGDNTIVEGMPTADPHVSGALWNSSGTVKISAG